jgi:uncharacterized membrane protein YhaH (DUF805 family)
VILAEIVDGGALWQTVWTAAVAGIGISIVYSIAVLGSSRSLDMRRAGRASARAWYAVLALVGAAGTIGAIAYAIITITTK